MPDMKRREFIALLGGGGLLLAAKVKRARGQQPAMPVIGFLNPSSADGWESRLRAFRQGLKDEGFVEGENMAVEYRWAENQFDRLPALAVELVHRQVAVSLARPGGNATGINFFSIELVAKRLEILREMVPATTRIAVLINPADAAAETMLKDVKAATRVMGLQIQVLNANTSHEIDAAFATFVRERPDALFVSGGPLLLSRRVQLALLAARHAVPASYGAREYVEIGGLMSYGANVADAYRQVGVYAGRILKGAKPADLPVMQSTKFELVINAQSARVLGLTVPDSLLARADEVIE
jgi:putative tryptophan/tyrosine transport system substrate-binding protein